MTQKTVTIKSKKFTGRQIAKMFDKSNMTGEDYIVNLNGQKYFGQYRQLLIGDYLAPVCDRNQATAIALCPDNGTYHYSIWLWLD